MNSTLLIDNISFLPNFFISFSLFSTCLYITLALLKNYRNNTADATGYLFGIILTLLAFSSLNTYKNGLCYSAVSNNHTYLFENCLTGNITQYIENHEIALEAVSANNSNILYVPQQFVNNSLIFDMGCCNLQNHLAIASQNHLAVASVCLSYSDRFPDLLDAFVLNYAPVVFRNFTGSNTGQLNPITVAEILYRYPQFCSDNTTIFDRLICKEYLNKGTLSAKCVAECMKLMGRARVFI